jgi:hypothetical protein
LQIFSQNTPHFEIGKKKNTHDPAKQLGHRCFFFGDNSIDAQPKIATKRGFWKSFGEDFQKRFFKIEKIGGKLFLMPKKSLLGRKAVCGESRTYGLGV